MKTVLRILVAPVTFVISLLIWLCAALISRTSLLFQIVSTVIGLFAVFVLLTTSVKNGLILLGVAIAVSPVGLPLLAAKLLGWLQFISVLMKGLIKN